MPPTSEPELVGWLLLFIPGLVALEVAGFYGRPTTQRGTLQWIVYGVLISLALEVVIRIVLDPFLRPWIGPLNHPVRRSGILVVMAVGTGIAIGWLQRRTDRWQQRSWKAGGTVIQGTGVSDVPRGPIRPAKAAVGRFLTGTGTRLVITYRRITSWFMAPRTERRVWIAFFKYQGWVRIELTNDQVIMGWARYYSDDPGDTVRELMIESVHLKRNGAWEAVPATLYVDSGQLRSVLRGPTRAVLEEADRLLSGARTARALEAGVAGSPAVALVGTETNSPQSHPTGQSE
jgi:hypothetical protein